MGLETLFRLSVIMRLSDLMSGPMRGAQVRVNETERSLRALQDRSRSMVNVGGQMAAAGVGMVAAMAMPAKATFETQAAIGEMSSLGVKDLNTLSRAATDFSNKWSGTTKAQFISGAYDIKSGVSSLSDTGVAEFTKLSALTAKATKATVQDMTSLFATGYGIYKDMYSKMSDEAFGRMFSGGIASAVQLFKTTGPGMAESISNLGAAATSAKRPLEEQLAVLGMLQATMPGAEAGTKYRTFVQQAASAGKQLGLSFVDQNNQLLSMGEIIGKLRSKYGETLDAMEKQQITKAFGSEEAVSLIDLMYPKLNQLKSNVTTLQSAMRGGTKVTEEMARAMNIDPGARWKILTQQMQNLKETIGGSLLPMFIPAVDKAGDLVLKLTAWAAANPKVTSGLATMIATLGILLAVAGGGGVIIGGLGYSIGTFGRAIKGTWGALSRLPDMFPTLRIRSMYAADGIKSMGLRIATMARQATIATATGLRNFTLGLIQLARQGLAAAARALPGLITSVWGFTAALLANPITWIVIGIIALIAVLVLLWRNWDTVTAAFSAGWQWIMGAFIQGKQFVTESLNSIGSFITGKYGEFRQSGAALLEAFTDGIKSVLMKPYETVQQGLSELRKLLPFSDAKQGPLSRLTRSGRALIETFAYGMETRRSLLSDTMNSLLGGMNLSPELSPALAFGSEGSYSAPSVGLMERSSVNMREIFREQTEIRGRETGRTGRGGSPLVALNYYGSDREEADSLMKDLERFLATRRK
ncbi:hypothetical protein JCM15765_02660 [Paradesulfitobacterium aromaticivorans]